MNLLENLAKQGFCRIADAQQSNGNSVRLLKDAAETYPAWLEAIAAAQREVCLENYIIQEDIAGNTFAEALIKAASRGIQCKVLYDWLGCMTRTSRQFWTRLKDAGVEIRQYNPPNPASPFGWISRDHRKVLCVDDRIAFTGGLCIGHDWVGNPEQNIAPWRDTAIEIHGPAVGHIKAAFLDSWYAAGAKASNYGPLHTHDGSSVGTVDISVIAGRPNSMGLYRLEQLVAEIVERSLWLSDGYFVATTGYVRALSDAARAGVDVRLLVPGSSNWPIVGALSQSSFRPLIESGVRVFEWNGPMLHCKTAVADSCWTRIGSSNSNLASWVSNRELDVTIKDEFLASQMEEMYENDLRNATEVILTRGRTGVLKPSSKTDETFVRPGKTNASRFLSGAIGVGSVLTGSFTQHRSLGSAEFLVLLGGGGCLLLLAAGAIFVPRLIAYPIAIMALFLATGFISHAWKLWKANRDTGHDN